MLYEITFKPARGRGVHMAYQVEGASLIEATATARRYVNAEAPGYMLAGYRTITPPALFEAEMAQLIAEDEAAERREAALELSQHREQM